jgi:hypothetical protein
LVRRDAEIREGLTITGRALQPVIVNNDRLPIATWTLDFACLLRLDQLLADQRIMLEIMV